MKYNTAIQYMDFIRPSFAPPSSWFGPVWTFLYILIAISFGYVFYKAIKKEIPFLVALPFILNLIFNALYIPLQFGFQNFVLASVDILLVLGTLIWAMIVVWKKAKWVTYAQIPYLLWVSFATVLQLSVTYLNSGLF
jgi:tryptophan-rich sensory protein